MWRMWWTKGRRCRLHPLKWLCVPQHLGSLPCALGEWSGERWLLSSPGRPWFTSATAFSLEAMPVALSSQTAGCWQLGGTFSWTKVDRTPRGKIPSSPKFTWESQSGVKPRPPVRSLWRRWDPNEASRTQQEMSIFVLFFFKRERERS